MNWIQTVSGKRLDLEEPNLEDINIEDIAYALSMKCRFNGHTSEFYSIAQHCVMVSEICPNELALAGLLHDANESYLPDVPRPVKDMPELSEYHYLENYIQATIERKFGLTLAREDNLFVKRADNVALATEGRDFMGDTEGWGLTEKPLDKKIVPWSPKYARLVFLTRFWELYGVLLKEEHKI